MAGISSSFSMSLSASGSVNSSSTALGDLVAGTGSERDRGSHTDGSLGTSSMTGTDASNPYDLMSLSNAETAFLFRSLPDSFFPRRHLHLPKKAKTLVLDLDETLIHSTSKSCKRYDTMIEVLMNKASCLYYVLRRPHVEYFLKKVSSIVGYTALI